jgi:hypothetical protein
VCTLRPGYKANKTLVPLFITALQQIFLSGKPVLKRSRNAVKFSGTSQQALREGQASSATNPAEEEQKRSGNSPKATAKSNLPH